MKRNRYYYVTFFAVLAVTATLLPLALGVATTPTPRPEQITVKCDKEGGSALIVSRPPRDRIRYYAKRHLGIRYLWGGTTHAGFDCSGFVQHIFSHAGFCLPRTSHAQASLRNVTRESWSRARRGDLVYWRAGHIAIYHGRWNRHHHIWESGRPGLRTTSRALHPGRSSWDRMAVPQHVNFKRLRRC